MRFVAILLGASALSGCAGYYEAQNDDRELAHHQQCQSYGFDIGTPGYSNCRMSLDQQDNSNRQALIGAYLANQPRQQPYVLPMPAQPVPPHTCSSMVNGQMITTTCN